MDNKTDARGRDLEGSEEYYSSSPMRNEEEEEAE